MELDGFSDSDALLAAVEPEEEEIALLNGERTRFRRRGVRESPTEQREDAWDSILPRDSRAAHHAETWETSVSGDDKTASREGQGEALHLEVEGDETMFMKVDDCIDDSDVGSDKMAMLPATRNVAGEPLEEGEGEEEEKEGEGGEEEPQDPDLMMCWIHWSRGKYQAIVFLLCGMAYIGFGVDPVLFSFISLKLQDEWNLSALEYGIIPSVNGVFSTFAGPCFSYASDHFG